MGAAGLCVVPSSSTFPAGPPCWLRPRRVWLSPVRSGVVLLGFPVPSLCPREPWGFYVFVYRAVISPRLFDAAYFLQPHSDWLSCAAAGILAFWPILSGGESRIGLSLTLVTGRIGLPCHSTCLLFGVPWLWLLHTFFLSLHCSYVSPLVRPFRPSSAIRETSPPRPLGASLYLLQPVFSSDMSLSPVCISSLRHVCSLF